MKQEAGLCTFLNRNANVCYIPIHFLNLNAVIRSSGFLKALKNLQVDTLPTWI